MMLRLNIVIANGVGCLFMLAIGWISEMVPIVRVTQISPAIATRMVLHQTP
ncbi:MAG: hypothetical protein VX745_06550 [Pseudomonadota bacterium]|nr:hypothetical protein [Pseudomonadota bacterium]